MDESSKYRITPHYPQSPPSPSMKNTSPSVDLKRWLHDALETLRRGKWHVLSMAVIVMVSAIAYVYTVTPDYEAQALLFTSTQPPTGQYEAATSGFITGPSGDRHLSNRYRANQIALLEQSLLIAERTAERLLDETADGGTTETVFADQPEDATPTDLARYLQKEHVTIRPHTEDTDAIWIIASSASPEASAQIANVYAEEYVKRTQETSRQRITSSRAFLEQQVTNRQNELRQLEEQIRDLNRNGAIALDAATERAITQTADLEAKLDAARVERRMHEASLASLEQEINEIRPGLAQRVASGLEKEIELTQSKIAELELYLEQVYTQNPELRSNPASDDGIQNVRSQVAQYRERVKALSEQYVSEMLAVGGINPTTDGQSFSYLAQLNRQVAEERVAISGLAAQIAALQERLAAYERQLASIPEQSMQLAQLQRAHQSTERLYLDLVQKLQETRIAEEAEIGYAEIIRPAFVPSSPVHPERTKIIGLGLFLSLLLGMGTAFVRQQLDKRIYTPDDLRSGLSPVLSAIPDMARLVHKLDLTPDPDLPPYAQLLKPGSPALEAYRRLYMQLQFNQPDRITQTVLIASAEEGTGKSTTAINMAITTSQTNRRTLIVDTDLRNPVIYNRMSLTPRPTLSNLLADPGASLDPEAFATDIANVYAIAGPGPVRNPATLLGSRAMRELIERLRATFDIIIFDSPPVLVATDAALLATQCDATVMLALSGHTDMNALTQSIDELEQVGATIAGTALNRFDPSPMYGYKTTYGYRYQPYAYRDESASPSVVSS